MPFIGNKPTAVPLTSADLEDNIITTAKIADANVTNPKLSSGSQQNFRNIIINGDMSIAQRGTSISGITGNSYVVDRQQLRLLTLGTWTMSQDTDVPTGQGFTTSVKIECTTADATPSTNDFCIFNQIIEGQNLQYLKKGTSSAESLTMSFWVKSNKTGTYIAELWDNDNTRTINKSYTIDSADTWEKKIITFEGDTTGAFDNDNGASLYARTWLAAGSAWTGGTLQTSWGTRTPSNLAVGQVNLADSTSNYINITGFQLEAGTTASDFEFLPYDVNLERCQRYYYVHAEGASKNIGMIAYDSNTYIQSVVFFPTSMRAAPSMINTSGTGYYRIYANNTSDDFDSFNVGIQQPTTTSCGIDCNANISGTAGHGGRCLTNNASSLLAFSSEL